jgi:D-mannonate dehydratase
LAIFILLHPLSLEPQGLQNSVIDSVKIKQALKIRTSCAKRRLRLEKYRQL